MQKNYKTKKELEKEIKKIKKSSKFIKFNNVSCAIKSCNNNLLLNKPLKTKFTKTPNGPNGNYYLCEKCYEQRRLKNNKRNIILYNKIKKDEKKWKDFLNRGNKNRRSRANKLKDLSQKFLENIGYDQILFKKQREQAGRYLFIDLLDKNNIISRNEHVVKVYKNSDTACIDLYIPCLNLFIEFKNTAASCNKTGRQINKYKRWIKEFNPSAKVISVDIIDSLNTDFDYLNFHKFIQEEINTLIKNGLLPHVNANKFNNDFNERIDKIDKNIDLIYSSSLSIKNKL